VTLIGSVRVSGGWARIVGNVQVPEGKTVKNKDLAANFAERSLQAYFKEYGKGGWKLVRHGYLSEYDVEYEGDQDAEAPWLLDEDFADN
jgi:hypothetical protein